MHAGLIILLSLAGLIVLVLLVLFISAYRIDFDRTYPRESPYYWFLVKLSVYVSLWGGRVRVSTEGTEKMPAEGTFLLVQNHRSNFDPIITWKVFWEKKLLFVSKTENKKKLVYGRLIHRIGCLYIDREDVRSSVKTIAKAAEILKEGKYSVGIYPEGTRSKTDELLPFHNGVFRAAQKAKVPIVVTAVKGSGRIWPNWPWKRTPVTLKVLEVIPPEEAAGMRTEEIGERVRKAMEAALKD